MRKQDFCICENKDADQLCSNGFRSSDRTIPLLLIHVDNIYFFVMTEYMFWSKNKKNRYTPFNHDVFLFYYTHVCMKMRR